MQIHNRVQKKKKEITKNVNINEQYTQFPNR